jgi:hypothetical protein
LENDSEVSVPSAAEDDLHSVPSHSVPSQQSRAADIDNAGSSGSSFAVDGEDDDDKDDQNDDKW